MVGFDGGCGGGGGLGRMKRRKAQCEGEEEGEIAFGMMRWDYEFMREAWTRYGWAWTRIIHMDWDWSTMVRQGGMRNGVMDLC